MYGNFNIAFVVFDLIIRGAFDEISFWIDKIKDICDSETIIHICGNKKDLSEEREIEFEERNTFTRNNNADYSETSTMTRFGIEEMFTSAISKYLETNNFSTIQNSNKQINDQINYLHSGCC